MKIFLDTANIDEIREIHAWGVLAGVTTNPSLMAREGRDFVEVIHEICQLIKLPVSAEVISQNAAGMITEGKLLAQISEHVVVKLPLIAAGLEACRALTDAGIRTNVTLCFSAPQALLAANAGATYVSPFVGRVDDISWDGGQLIDDIATVFANDPDISTQILAASIRHPMHFVASAMSGADVSTVPYAVLKKCLQHPLTHAGNEAFLADWASVGDVNISARVQSWLDARG